MVYRGHCVFWNIKSPDINVIFPVEYISVFSVMKLCCVKSIGNCDTT